MRPTGIAWLTFILTASNLRSATVEGLVRQSGGTQLPIAGARVTLFTPDLSYFRESRTAPNGQCTFTGVPEGTYRVGASTLRFEYREVVSTVGAGGASVDFLLGPDIHPGRWTVVGDTFPEAFGATNSGTLQPDGKAIFCHDTIDPVVFDPVTGAKTFPPASPSIQGCHMTTLLSGGQVLFAGGQNTGDFRDAVKTVKMWNPQSATWTVLPDLNEERWYPGLMRLADGRLLACGGGQRPNAQRTATCEIFDPDTRIWQPTGSLAQPTEYPPAALLFTGELLLTWYPPQLFNPSSGTWRSTGNFIQPARGFPDHSDHSLILLPDGRPMAIGIKRTAAPSPSMTEFYDPASGTWSLGPSPATIRSRPEVVMLPGGSVLAAGGKKEDDDPVPVNPWGYVKLADLFEPSTTSWRRASDMVVAREYHATTLLVPDGRVITTGGTGEPGNPTPGSDTSIEAFEPPYLFRGTRPRIDSMTTTQLCGGRSSDMSVSFTSAVTSVLLLGTNSVTHWVDGGIPRQVSLPFSQSGSVVTVQIANDPVLIPQGWYILFAMVDDIPSEGRIVHVTHSVPQEIPTLTVDGQGPTGLSWSLARSNGTPLTYDVATGRLFDLRSTGFGNGECLASSIATTNASDSRQPLAGEGYYYMVRARNVCFAGTYGSGPRDQHGTLSGQACP